MKSKMFIAVLAACAGICGQTYGAVKDDEPKKAELDSASEENERLKAELEKLRAQMAEQKPDEE